ncbi:MAG TPA: acyl carrier protein [Candidatus Binataceae bacterium]|nr:acyl carrier protein [Candidatus Binataceae bacterium]
MTEADIYSSLTEIFHEVFDDVSIVLRPDLTARDIKEWDSANHITLIVSAEARFGVRFKTAELESPRNVGEFVRLIEQKLAAKRK